MVDIILPVGECLFIQYMTLRPKIFMVPFDVLILDFQLQTPSKVLKSGPLTRLPSPQEDEAGRSP